MERDTRVGASIAENGTTPNMTTIYALIDLDTSGIERTLHNAGQEEGVDYHIVRASDELNYPSFVSPEGVSYLGKNAVSAYLASCI